MKKNDKLDFSKISSKRIKKHRQKALKYYWGLLQKLGLFNIYYTEKFKKFYIKNISTF